MIFSKNITNISLLELELSHLKSVYRKALEAKNKTSIIDLRKKIKVLQARWHIMRDCPIVINNYKELK